MELSIFHCLEAAFVSWKKAHILPMESNVSNSILYFNLIIDCIRPCDMTGKSSAVILRQMHPNVVEESVKYDRHIDLPMWMTTLSLDDKAIPYY